MNTSFKALIITCILAGLSSFSGKKVINYSIFGSKYAAVEISDESLKGHIYYLISGHGGIDPGAITTLNGELISEDEYAYDVSLRLARNLLSHGARVYMIARDENDGIRDETILPLDQDETVWKGQSVATKQSSRLKQRTDAINTLATGFPNAKVQQAIEIHIDSRSEDKNVDVFFYHQSAKPESLELADRMLNTLKTNYDRHQSGRGYTGINTARGLYTLKNCNIPTVYVELGNIANAKDQKRILNPSNRQAIANWFCQAIAKD